jgi:two-component system OmpR family response regulator
MRRIAIVEDEPAIRANYADALRRHGYEVAAYASRPEAMAAFRTRLPDLALVDVGLGDEVDGGFTLTRELRAMSPTLPIIFLSARDSDFDIVAGLRLGADDYLTKDASLPHLAARIAALFRRSELLAAPPSTEDIVERGPLRIDVKRLTGRLERPARRPHADRVLDGARARAPSGARQGSRCADARREHRRRRQHDHVAHQAHPPQVHGGRPAFDRIATVYGMGYRWGE